MDLGNDYRLNVTAPPRPNERNPEFSSCKPAYRRICGVCRHFQGSLVVGGKAHCAALVVTVDCHRNAKKCPRWERKGVQDV